MLRIMKRWQTPAPQPAVYLPKLVGQLADNQRIVEVGCGFGRHLRGVSQKIAGKYIGLDIGYRVDFAKLINPSLDFVRCQLKPWQIADALRRFHAGLLVIRLRASSDLSSELAAQFAMAGAAAGMPVYLASEAADGSSVLKLVAGGDLERAPEVGASLGAPNGNPDDQPNEASWPDIEGIHADFSIPAYLGGHFIENPSGAEYDRGYVFSDEETAAAVSAAKAARRPWSLVRLGNGEARLIGHPDYVTPIWLSRSLKNWFGDRSNEGAWQDIRTALMGAIVASDLVGIPAGQASDAHWILADRMLRLYGCMPHTGDLCRHGFHIHAMRTRFFEDLIRGETTVGIISPHDVGEQLMAKFGVGEIIWHPIPGQAKFFRDRHVEKHFPDVFTSLKKNINPRFTGQIYLVGAGPLGKVYCQWIKEAGGIGIDVGSVLDVWAGYATRSGFEKILNDFTFVSDASKNQPMLRKA